MHHIVFFAVIQEQAPFLARLKSRGIVPQRSLVAGLPRLAQVHETPGFTVVVTGMGLKNARLTAEKVLSLNSSAVVWTCGFAGGLNPSLELGTLVYDADSGFPFASALAGAGARLARLATIEKVAVTQAQKSQLHQRLSADAVDMESVVIRQIAAACGCTSATVRAISDTADQDLPLDFNALATDDGGINPMKLAGSLLAAPHKIPRLIRFGRETAQVSAKLADFLAKVTLDGKASSPLPP